MIMAASRPMLALALSVGCPCGIGPEVSVVAAARARVRIILVGDERVVRRAARLRRVAQKGFVRVERAEDARALARGTVAILQPTPDLPAKDARPGSPTVRSGAAQLAWIDAACDLTASGRVDGMVTGPVSKEAIVRSRAPGSRAFRGHTEHLARRLRAPEVVMAFWTPRFSVSLVTTHVPLATVPRAVTAPAVARATFWLAWLLERLAAGRRVLPVAIASLNPHAGEGGILGREEGRVIGPGILLARKRLDREGVPAPLVGPVPAESALRHAAAGRFAGVVAMYHDQGTIPMKLQSFGEAVNVSLGLPIVRTSVDHGTAYDLAGKGVADARGMQAAIELATRLANGGTASATSRTPARQGPRRRSPPR
jgi:4-hydroxythreonine-4-phosphate dehydrogenase